MQKIKQPAPVDFYPAFRQLAQAHTRLDAPNFGCGIALGCGRLEMGADVGSGSVGGFDIRGAPV